MYHLLAVKMTYTTFTYDLSIEYLLLINYINLALY